MSVTIVSLLSGLTSIETDPTKLLSNDDGLTVLRIYRSAIVGGVISNNAEESEHGTT
jgi:hypothetical protein